MFVSTESVTTSSQLSEVFKTAKLDLLYPEVSSVILLSLTVLVVFNVDSTCMYRCLLKH